MWASVYSSETGVWTTSSSIQLDVYIEGRPSLLAGDALYFSAQQGKMILKYDLVGQKLGVINAPDMFEPTEGIVVTAEDGGLGIAGVKDGNLHLWSWQAGPRGIAEWVHGRVVKLRMLFTILNPLASLDVIGFQEGTDTIFISIDMDVFAVMLRSEQVKKVGKTGSKYAMAPYVSFYTPGPFCPLVLALSVGFSIRIRPRVLAHDRCRTPVTIMALAGADHHQHLCPPVQMYRVLLGCLVLAQGAFLQGLLVLEIAISE
uniref:F-box protein AT5G49610-like beta-propeller domain-containing protein n=1 Tax=Saccharum officinarum TaxID=4547 RepID=A0A678TPX5_SACOF|nr:hypothetical protein SO80C16_000003 [Saccharum officinarum]